MPVVSMLNSMQPRFSSAAKDFPEAPIFLALAAKAGIISLAGGVPDPAAFPTAAVRQAADAILSHSDTAAKALQYAPSQGYEPLRHWLAADMADRGITVRADQILVTQGAQQALDLIGKLYIDPGDEIAVTSPTFFAALDTFRAYRPRFLPIGYGRNGIDMSAARDALERRPKFLYLIPDYQNPTGLSLSQQERAELMNMASRFAVPIIEDAAYDRLRYGGNPTKPFAAMNGTLDDGLVIYVNTFSKVIAPGLRVGWLAGNRTILAKLAALKLATDVHTSIFNQQIVLQIATSGLDAAIERTCTLYSKRRDAMLSALKRHMPEGAAWTEPDGGMFIWLEIPGEVDTSALFPVAASEARMAFVPGRLSCTDGAGTNACRLSFASVDEARIGEAISRLGNLLSQRAHITRGSLDAVSR